MYSMGVERNSRREVLRPEPLRVLRPYRRTMHWPLRPQRIETGKDTGKTVAAREWKRKRPPRTKKQYRSGESRIVSSPLHPRQLPRAMLASIELTAYLLAPHANKSETPVSNSHVCKKLRTFVWRYRRTSPRDEEH